MLMLPFGISIVNIVLTALWSVGLLASWDDWNVKGIVRDIYDSALLLYSLNYAKSGNHFSSWLFATLALLQKNDVRFYHVLLIFQTQRDDYGAVAMTKGLFSWSCDERSSEAVPNQQTAFCSRWLESEAFLANWSLVCF